MKRPKCKFCGSPLKGDWGGRGEHCWIKCDCLGQVRASIEEMFPVTPTGYHQGRYIPHSIQSLERDIERMGVEHTTFRYFQPVKPGDDLAILKILDEQARKVAGR